MRVCVCASVCVCVCVCMCELKWGRRGGGTSKNRIKIRHAEMFNLCSVIAKNSSVCVCVCVSVYQLCENDCVCMCECASVLRMQTHIESYITLQIT